jgi:putative zinc finger/helix-turn-helix YgiT family protein
VTRECFSCGNAMKSSLETRRYGTLVNVILENVPVHRCPACGEEEVEIPRIEELHTLIAELVARKPTRLTAGEIRWLRTHLGFSSVDFAKLMGVSPETVSRWERLDAPKRMGLPAESLLRMLAIHRKPIADYGLTSMGSTDKEAARPIRIAKRQQHWASACPA